MRTEEIDRDGVRLRIRRTELDPDASTVLFVNAVGMPTELLAGVAADFQRAGFNFVTWELRGSPGPSADRSDCSLATQAADGVAIVAGLGVSTLHLAGWCTGASVALFMVRQLGEAVSSLVLVDGAFLFDGVPGAPLGNAMYAMCREIVADVGVGAYYHELIRPRGNEETVLGLKGQEGLVNHVTLPYRQGEEELVRYAFGIHFSCDYDPVEICSSITCPTLLTARRDDRMVSFRNSIRAAEFILQAQVTIADSGGHYGLFTDQLAVREMFEFMLSTEASMVVHDATATEGC